MLVLGDIAQKNGLGISLLQRLQLHYQNLGTVTTQCTITLSENYRCHSAILELVGGLFYDSQLSWAKNESEPLTHRGYKYPLAFVCSDFDRSPNMSKSSYLNEADTIVEKAIEIAKSCPSGWAKPPMPHLFIVSPNEEQVCLVL